MSKATKSLNSLSVLVCLFLVISFPGLKASDSDVSPQTATIEAPFGKAEVNLVSPSLTKLYLRGPNGLTEQSLLSVKAANGNLKARPWTLGGYTYVIGTDARRYESRLTKPDGVEVSGHDAQTVIKITGVKLTAAAGETPVATEDWVLSAPGDGAQLVWQITRHWQKDFTATLSASPSLFFSFGSFWDPIPLKKNSITTTLWYDPLHLKSEPSEDEIYADHRDRSMSDNHLQTIRDRDSWAIYKMWTNWHAPVDLRLEVKNGYLFRRGVSYAQGCEAGAVMSDQTAGTYHQGQTGVVALGISGVDKYSTGYQLSISLPDKATEASLKDFYGSLLNGGTVCDPKDFDFGNEPDGIYYAGESWMSGAAMAAGVPAPGKLSLHPYDVTHAYREHLAHIFSVVDKTGRAHFGYNSSGNFVDDDLSTLLGADDYLLHSGDLPFIRQNLPVMERMLDYFVKNTNEKGLFRFTGVTNYWYYDAMTHAELMSYHNALFYKAALDMAEMETAGGHPDKAAEYTALAEKIKKAFNEVFWKEDAPGGPRYIDGIYASGKQDTYFCDMCQWPALAVGLASPEQGRKLIATADARLAVLAKEDGYPGTATVSALWPAPPETMSPKNQYVFGKYMNGGCLLSQTYWEIVARARYGDNEGAAKLLKGFAKTAAAISWVGNNSASIKGDMDSGGDGELYLADMVVVPAAVINGVLGITPTWAHLEVTPHLPADWPKAEADVLYKGRKQHVTIENGKVSITPGEQVINLPLLWVMDFNLRTAPTGTAVTSNIDFLDNYDGKIRLKQVYDDHGISDLWRLDETDGPVLDASPHNNQGTIRGTGTVRGVPGPTATSKAYSFDGHGYVEIPPDDTFLWLKDRSSNFTAQCWFKTTVTTDKDMILMYKSGAYHLHVSNGKALVALTDSERDGLAHGTALVADGKWHHMAVVFDRQANKISLYIDGKLDTPDGKPTAQNPGDLSSVGMSAAVGAEWLGGAYGIPSFVGSLADVSITRGVLQPSEFSFQHDYPSPVGKPGATYAASGSYQSPPYDWTVAAKLTDLTVTADLNGGEVTATVETSDDGFKTIASTTQIPIQDGVNTYSLASLDKAAQAVRVRLELKHGADATQTPIVDAFQITAMPVQ